MTPSIPAGLAPFLTESGLARMNEMSADVLFTNSTKAKTPAEVHNFLKRFLYDSYQFRTSLDVYAFLLLLVDANTNNATWSAEDGQLLLTAIAKDNGFKRICDILGWREVSATAGNSKDILSFQRAYIPLLQYLASDFVTKSVLSHLSKDLNGPRAILGGVQVFGALAGVLLQVVTRIKNVTVTQALLRPLVLDVERWVHAWIKGLNTVPPSFDDPLSAQAPDKRIHLTDHIQTKIDQLVSIVNREHSKLERMSGPSRTPKAKSIDGILAALHTTYVGPGNTRTEGPRHDNDHVDINDIRIAPTHEELTCRTPPFLPANRHGAPHPQEQGSVELLQDVQFRLLREELTYVQFSAYLVVLINLILCISASLRTSIQAVLDDLSSPRGKTQLAEVLKKQGGKYRGQAQEETLLFNIYTGVQFNTIAPDYRGLSVSVSLDAPPGRARSNQTRSRTAFWEGASGKRLLSGGLVALIWQRGNTVDVHLGVISSSLRDLVDSSKHDSDRISIRINFFDPSIELRILQELHRPPSEHGGLKLLVEATVMFESIRPFLEALRVEPTTLPFAKYLVHQSNAALTSLHVDPPRYARLPGFRFELSSLFPDGSVDMLKLSVTDPASIENARRQLRSGSCLDPSQADAIVDALTRELALIQGPPGTGKSYTGVQLIRVLLANHAGPILMIAFTNHALDHMLMSVLEANITEKIVRLGSRSADETISQFSLENMEKVAGRSRLERAFASLYYDLKNAEKAVDAFMKDYLKAEVESGSILEYVEIFYPIQHYYFFAPPQWVSILHQTADSGEESQWQQVGRGGRTEDFDGSIYAYWRSGGDLEFIQAAHASQTSQASALDPAQTRTDTNSFAALANDDPDPNDEGDPLGAPSEPGSEDEDEDDRPEERWRRQQVQVEQEDEAPAHVPDPIRPPPDDDHVLNALHVSDLQDLSMFFEHFGSSNQIPPLPALDRPLEVLLDEEDIWSLSFIERKRLHEYWTRETRQHHQEAHDEEFERLRERHKNALKNFTEAKSASRSQLLRDVDIIGCTTNGAAKLTELLKAIGPRVMLVEEAGQVLEAHVLGSLVPSVQHMILVGDPLQLRPTIENYSLSMDHPIGGQLYKFDMSLMERLSSSGLTMSQINVQRRMRPQISNLIRTYLYPNLEDHELVKQHPDVRGMGKSVFFVTHNHKENAGEDDSVSKFNQYEVNMVVDLVMYLLRQGPYSAEGDIVVLCAYLGQLARMRDALADKVAVIIDERDQVQLADQEGERDEEDPLQELHATVDHIKVSKRVRLRTIDNYQGEEAKIVILTLVRNSGGSDDDNVAGRSTKGRVNVGFLKSENRTNVALSRAREGLYIFGNHYDLSSRSKMWRSIIEQLEKDHCVGEELPVVCAQHKDRVQYISKPGQLPQIAPDGGCLRQCNKRLKCGHACPYKCHSDDPKHISVTCEQACTKLCPRGHPCKKACAEDCGACMTRIPSIELPCGHVRDVLCYQLDDLSNVSCDIIVRKPLAHCEHEADLQCSTDPASFKCTKVCGGVMAYWTAAYGGKITRFIRARGGSIVNIFVGRLAPWTMNVLRNARTPAAKYALIPRALTTAQPRVHLAKKLARVCGEDCDIQICPVCEPLDDVVVDMILSRTLADVDPDMGTVDDMLITIPNCRHVFTIETLDGICDMPSFYEQSPEGTWLRLKAPPADFMKPPTCPTCRAAITCPRYGRIFKRADLDILERNITSSMSQSLEKVADKVHQASSQPLKERLKPAATQLKANLTKSESFGDTKDRRKKQKRILKETRINPLPYSHIDAMGPLHGLARAEVKAWRDVVQILFNAYREAVTVASTRSSHIHAWEASFSYLFNKEMESAAQDPARAPRNPQQHAMRMARMNVGQPQPRADSRFRVEAFWMTINIRLILVDLAKAWADELSSVQDGPVRCNRQLWDDYVSFLIQTCEQDVQITLDITQKADSHRQTVRTNLLLLRIKLEEFRFNVDMMRQSSETFTMQMRSDLADRAHTLRQDTRTHVHAVLRGHVARNRDDVGWLRDNFSVPSQVILDEWENLETSLRRDTFYAPVSLQEMTDIVKALNFSHRGHFYKCPNGHTFVITECGGAMETARCPECGEAIGGSDHSLNSTNTRDTQMEGLAAAQGALQSPWDWGQGA
ncbi:hypothetical protein EUX98_g4067 [Antrodiella citrinella]|uniref:RZ-type domain-containing protein n=1 Tax=Antrodiella citrinella TaxID=2447956 RepID=A0A4S4MX09_9APHY|nr:hypothetical protein EUX98_g4067 [Antrodiella citrinella]